MTHHTSIEHNDALLDHLVRRIDQTIAQCLRFEQLSSLAAQWAEQCSTSTLKLRLQNNHMTPLDHQMALVALALQATDESGAVLDAYDPATCHSDKNHHLFYQIVRIEWEQRYQPPHLTSMAA